MAACRFGRRRSRLRGQTPNIAANRRLTLRLRLTRRTTRALRRALGQEKRRPTVRLCLRARDAGGWQMAVSVARKLQAFKALEFPGLDFEVRPIALTPEQVREYGLPSTALKDTERRADAWTAAMGV